MNKFTRKQINEVINLKGVDGNLIDVFALHGLLFVDNSQDGEWNLDKTYCRFSEHSLGISFYAFEDCKTEDDVHNVFHDESERSVKDKLV